MSDLNQAPSASASTPSEYSNADVAKPEIQQAVVDGDNELRLHRFSWLFVLLTQLRSMFFPLVVLIFFGRGSSMDFLGVAAALSLALYSLIYSYGFRYRLSTKEIIVKEGIFDRTERHVPFERVQNITQARNVLHRLFGVTELRLESAGGQKPEAVMNVITVAEAERLERIIKRRERLLEQPGLVIEQSQEMDADAKTLLEVPNGDLLRLGLSSNRGVVLLGALWAASWQFGDDNQTGQMVKKSFNWIWNWVTNGVSADDWLTMGFRVLEAVVLFVVLLRILSVLLTFLKFHRFKLERIGDSLRAESGLLTRVRANAAINRVQRLVIEEPWLMRKMQRRTLGLNVLGARAQGGQDNAENEKHRLKWLAPIAPIDTIENIVSGLFANYVVRADQWQPLHPRAWVREARGGFLGFCIPGCIVSYFSPLGLLFFVLAIWQIYAARRWADSARYALTDTALAFRAGWLKTKWVLVPRDKMQAVRMVTSPFDRRAGMAKLCFDISGGDQMGYAIEIPYLPEAQANAMFKLLQRSCLGELSPQ